ncbi:MAG: hypothetical protein HWN66_21635 [Candidatus Helarchaeota archaeon]|nr:hypothetical protein [Candidatus Helarchaeota archaeon]
MVNLTQYSTKIKISVLGIQIITYAIFLASHFMVWGFTINPIILPIIPDPFIGLETRSGMISISLLSALFLYGYAVNALFFFKDEIKKHNRVYWAVNTITIICCSIVFTYSIIGIFHNWKWVYLDKLIFGFYLWLFSVIISIGILLYLNFKFKTINQISNSVD